MKLAGLILVIVAALVTSLQAGALDEQGINALPLHPLGITGQGVQIAVLSHGNARTSHIAFLRKDGRPTVTNHDFTGLGLSRSDHDTQIAGLLVSQGSPTHPETIGAAYGANVHCARIIGTSFKVADLTTALDTLITKYHCRVFITGVQLPADKVTPDGSSVFSRIYDHYADTYDVIFANAAGNSSPQITVFGDCYNASRQRH